MKQKLLLNRRIRLGVLALIILVLLYSFYLLKAHTTKTYVDKWVNTPDVTILCRLYNGSVLEYYNIFSVSYLLFWPYQKWLNSKLVLVLDGETKDDSRMGTILANLPPYPEVHFEEYKENTFCSDWRREGYSRQQYSNFYSDHYTQSEFIGIVDSDSFFVTSVTPEDLFVNKKPRIYGYNGCCRGWEASLKEAIGNYNIGEFMLVIGFPVLIRRSHFSLVRQHIKKRMNANTFEEAFKLICSKYPNKYSQFDLLIHYLWHYKRDEYSWHIRPAMGSNHAAFQALMSDKPLVLNKNKPIIGLMKHGDHMSFYDLFNLIYGYVCVGSNMTAGDCKKMDIEENSLIKAGYIENFFVDYRFYMGFWPGKSVPSNQMIAEMPWSTEEMSYQEAYKIHENNLNKRDYTNAWKWKEFH